jgi:hypothetical protein
LRLHREPQRLKLENHRGFERVFFVVLILILCGSLCNLNED